MYFHLPGCVVLHQNEIWKHGTDEAAAAIKGFLKIPHTGDKASLN